LTLPVESRLTVVHRHDCDLCDEMVSELQALGHKIPLPQVSIVDVDADPELLRRYGLNVPVLLLDGSVVCKYRLDAEELRRLLRPRAPKPRV
jgi:predicted thioredoxin/glutaredoxin